MIVPSLPGSSLPTSRPAMVPRLHELFGGPLFFYLPPFPTALPHNMPQNPGYVPSFSWTLLKEALEGAKVVARWKDLAKAGTLFDCNGPTCSTIIHGFSRSEKSAEDALALCRVYLVGKILGAPENCSSIAIFAPDNTWIKIVMGHISVLDVPSGTGGGYPDFK